MIRLWRMLFVCVICSAFSLILSEGEIFSWTFQSPSYLLEKDTPGLGSYTCDISKDACKVNFDFTNSVPTTEPASHFTCIIDFGFGVTGQENKCNPNTVEFPVGEWNVHLVVKKISDDTVVNEGTVQIVRPDDSLNPLLANFAREWQSPTHLLLKEDLTLSEYSCDPLELECKFNLKIIPLYDGIESSKLTCNITSDFELIPTSDPCNPNTSIVPTGDHILTIQILDKSDSTVLLTSTITLKNTPVDTTIDPTRVMTQRTWQSPTYLVEHEDATKTEYSCDPEKSECKINLLVTPLLDGIASSRLTCEITSDFELIPTSDPCNPNTSPVPVGDHTLTIKILDKTHAALLQTTDILIHNTPPDTTIDPARVTTDIAWQQPTYFLEKDDLSLSLYTCDPAKTECKANLLVTPKLDGAESSKLICRITAGFGLDEADCNPDTFVIPTGDHNLTIEILNAATGGLISTRVLKLVGIPEKTEVIVPTGGGGGGGGSSSFITPLLDLTSSKITVQSGLDASGVCKTEICQVNFLAIVPDDVICQWDFGSGVFETVGTDKKCNPGYVKFSSDTMVTLSVIDANNPTNIVVKTIQVYRTQIPELSTLSAQIDLQTKINKTKRLTDTGVICALGKAKKCSLNFTASESVGAKTWHWDFGNGQTSEKENPAAESFEIGKYRVRLTVSNGVMSDMTSYDVEVVQTLDEEIVCLDCDKNIGKIQITAVLPNPPHADTVEWIEIKNISSEFLSLKGCEISDESESYALTGTLTAGKTLRLRQAQTGLSLGNTHESLTLKCGDNIIDTFTWDFSVPSGYILRRDVLLGNPEKTTVTGTVDGDTIDVTLDGKKVRLRLLGIDTPETVHPRKPIEQFGREASDYTRKTLLGKEVWLTFDHEPIDHYGRRLAYVWQCSGEFSEDSCTLFNASIVEKGYGRMERRFEFRLYDQFDEIEKKAKKEKRGIWSDTEVAKEMNALGNEEEDLLMLEQEKEFLELQEELLAPCEEEDPTLCEEETPTWSDVTKKISTLNVSAKKTGIIAISGRTWGDFPLSIQIFQDEQLVHEISSLTDEAGEYEESWIPKIIGEYTVRIILLQVQNPSATMDKDQNAVNGENGEIVSLKPLPSPLSEGEENGKIPPPPLEEGRGGGLSAVSEVTLEKKVPVETISDHFSSPLQASIQLQGQITDNRWLEGNTFHCRSRGSCSINVTAETNRSNNLEYVWIFPDGTIFDGKNPASRKLEYGQYNILLIVSDSITDETIATMLHINHSAIPKAPKKPKKAASSNYTLDLKDVPQDKGGGVAIEAKNPLDTFFTSLVILASLGGIGFLFLKPRANIS